MNIWLISGSIEDASPPPLGCSAILPSYVVMEHQHTCGIERHIVAAPAESARLPIGWHMRYTLRMETCGVNVKDLYRMLDTKLSHNLEQSIPLRQLMLPMML